MFTRSPEPVMRDVTLDFAPCTSVDVISLTSTITNEDHILWPNERAVFTCETRGSVLVNNWTSNDYIGDGISLIFNNLELGNDTQYGSRSIAKLTKVNYNYVMVSQLHITTSSMFQTSSVVCTNFNGTSKIITFSVLGMNNNNNIVIIVGASRSELIIISQYPGSPSEPAYEAILEVATEMYALADKKY